ncbi:MAG: 4-hydroxy-tetrahydrodipicolinate reductase, partial [Candidatus Omnitrophota bacterium]
MIRLVMAGAAGRMGKMILQLAGRDKAFSIAGALEQRGHAALGQDLGPILGRDLMGVKVTQDATTAMRHADVLIDFSHFSALPENLKAAVKTRTACVIGTTGIPAATLRQIQSASRKIPIVQSPNMSLGVNLLFQLAAIAGKALDESYDLEITEIHHRMKKDAPSGTAMKLLEILLEARGRDIKKD